MERFPARIRSTKLDGHDVYDVPFTWENGRVRSGVVFESHLLIRPEYDTGKALAVTVWLDGQPRDVTLPWDDDGVSIPIPAPGLASVVCWDDVPLLVFWELVAGRADGA